MKKTQLNLHAVTLKAMAHPARLCIINTLLQGNSCVTTLLKCVSLSQPNISQHLAILKNAGIVQSEIEGSRRCYSLTNTKAMKRILQSLDSVHGDEKRTRAACL